MSNKVAHPKSGFALLVILIIITVLAILAGSFALSMRVEKRLSGNANSNSEMEWLGRSGVEFARFVLANSGNGRVTSLNQFWAGGPGVGPETNGPLAGLSLTNNTLGEGRFSVHIRDLESLYNINLANQDILNRALTLVGVDPSEDATIVDSILDWRDRDDSPRPSGTESQYYLSLNPPYRAKDGPIDDLSELLLVRGITPAIYWGPSASMHGDQLLHPNPTSKGDTVSPSYPIGLADLFTALSIGRVNLNTASVSVLQLLPGVDQNIAENIVRARAGPDGVEGTEDDTPFQSPAMLFNGMVPGLSAGANPLAGRIQALVGVQSATFQVTVDAQIGSYHKRFTAILRRVSPQDIRVIEFGW